MNHKVSVNYNATFSSKKKKSNFRYTFMSLPKSVHGREKLVNGGIKSEGRGWRESSAPECLLLLQRTTKGAYPGMVTDSTEIPSACVAFVWVSVTAAGRRWDRWEHLCTQQRKKKRSTL